MCIIVAKYFPGTGWAGAKNRDRKYVPTLDFEIRDQNGIEQALMHDQITGYREGINSAGVSILNTSLDVLEDEPDVESGRAKTSPDGELIRTALAQKNPLVAAKYLIAKQLVGCTVVFDQEHCYLIEASDQDGTKPYRYRLQEIPKDHVMARTNHGLWLEWAGFQRGDDAQQTRDRISSESRLLQAQAVAQIAKQPQDLVDGLCKITVEHPQLNAMRTSTGRNEFRTTSQQLCVPKEKTLYCRPVSSNLQFDFWKLNRPDTKVWVEILSNRELWQRAPEPPPFDNMQFKDV